MLNSGPHPHSCHTCRNRFLIYDDGKRRTLPNTADGANAFNWRLWDPEQKPINVGELRTMSMTGCAFAKFLVKKLEANVEILNDQLVLCRYPPSEYDEFPDSLVIGLSTKVLWVLLALMARAGSCGARHWIEHRWLMYSCRRSSGARSGSTPPYLYPGSSESLLQVKSWMRECIQTHTSCAKPLARTMPTRVLEIGQRGVTICQDPPLAPYITLSYCWGGPQPVILSRAMLERDDMSISWEDLPITFREAIRATSELGFRYLWIDALCIVQDGDDDISREVSEMAEIYEGTYATIHANRAASVSDGFLEPRPPFGPTDDNVGFELPYCCTDGTVGSVIAVEEEATIAYTNPLSKRAWAFQEFVLSPRVISFGHMATSWSCQSEETTTDGFIYELSPSWCRLRFHQMGIGNGSSELALLSAGAEDERAFCYNFWNTLVQVYMSAESTYSQDRFPALSGIARRFGTYLGDDYIAGGWKGGLWSSLVWWTGKKDSSISTYHAPSWSWAAIPDGRIGYVSTNSCHADEGFCLLDHKIELRNRLNQFGATTAGFIRVRGRVTEACFGGSKDESDAVGNLNLLQPEGKDILIHDATCNADHLRSGNTEEALSLLFLCTAWDYKRNKMYGICLQEQADGTVTRFGLGHFYLGMTTAWELQRDEATEEIYAKWRAGIALRTLHMV